MLNFLFLFIFNFLSTQKNAISVPSWISKNDDFQEVRIYSDDYFAVSKYNIEDNTFISAYGGLYFIDNKGNIIMCEDEKQIISNYYNSMNKYIVCKTLIKELSRQLYFQIRFRDLMLRVNALPTIHENSSLV